jgi:hypothetical protein
MFNIFTALPTALFAAAPVCKKTLLGLIPWYQYLTLDPKDCHILNFDNANQVLGQHSAFLLIILAIIDDLLRIAAFVAVGYIIYGGIQYITSQGAPDSTKKALSTIINALIGLAVAIMSASIVGYLGHKLGTL